MNGMDLIGGDGWGGCMNGMDDTESCDGNHQKAWLNEQMVMDVDGTINDNKDSHLTIGTREFFLAIANTKVSFLQK